MKSLRVFLIALSLIAYPVTASAAVGAGGACSKAGMKATSKGKIYTCVKVGKKLKWDSGTPVKTQESAPAASAVASIRKAAFETVHAKPCATSHALINVERVIGGKFSVDLAKTLDGLTEQTFNCFDGFFTSPITLKVFYFNELDEPTVDAKTAQYLPSGELAHLHDVLKDSINKKWGNNGSAGGFVTTMSGGVPNSYVMVFHISSYFNWNDSQNKLVMHEFTHVLQKYARQGYNPPNQDAWAVNMPPYFMEGGAEALGYSFENKSAESYDSQMKNIERQMTNDPSTSSFRSIKDEAGAIEKMRELTALKTDAAQGMQYAYGGLMSEYLLGTYGLDKYLQLMRGASTYPSFSDNLKATVGVTQEEFFKAAAPYVLSSWKAAGN